MLQLGAVLAEVLDQGRHEVLAGGQDGAEAQLLLGPRGHPAGDLGALLEQADHVGGVARVGRPAAVGRTLRPARSVSSTPSSRSSAATAALTLGCVTYSSCAAAVTEPCLTTARKAVSWV